MQSLGTGELYGGPTTSFMHVLFSVYWECRFEAEGPLSRPAEDIVKHKGSRPVLATLLQLAVLIAGTEWR